MTTLMTLGGILVMLGFVFWWLDLFVYTFVALKILNPNFEVLEKNMAGVEAKPLKKVNKPYKIRREGSFVNGFR